MNCTAIFIANVNKSTTPQVKCNCSFDTQSATCCLSSNGSSDDDNNNNNNNNNNKTKKQPKRRNTWSGTIDYRSKFKTWTQNDNNNNNNNNNHHNNKNSNSNKYCYVPSEFEFDNKFEIFFEQDNKVIVDYEDVMRWEQEEIERQRKRRFSDVDLAEMALWESLYSKKSPKTTRRKQMPNNWETKTTTKTTTITTTTTTPTTPTTPTTSMNVNRNNANNGRDVHRNEVNAIGIRMRTRPLPIPLPTPPARRPTIVIN
eukprot:Pgem_evm1s405